MSNETKFTRLAKTLGPGIMFAGTCVGGSHLAQSTKAGAYYGFGLLLVVLAANFFKYPFFEFASRYTNATGDSILEGYKRLGKWTLYLYAAVTIVSMFIITAAIGTLTGGLASNMFEAITGFHTEKDYSDIWPGIMFLIVLGILVYGKFGLLDKTLKVVGLVLVLTVTVAFFSVLFGLEAPQTKQWTLDIMTNKSGLTFAIALMGWMPIAVDMSAWASLWTQERIKQTGYHPTLKETLFDFNFGYITTVVLAVFFLTIGAFILFEHPEYTPAKIADMTSLGYAKTLVDMFTEAVGGWSYFVITVAAFATMFGTCITLIDGYCRSIERTLALLQTDHAHEQFHKKKYLGWVITLVIGSFVIILFEKLGGILNFATILSFIIAPIAAVLNYKIIFNKEVKAEFQPSSGLKWLAIAGVVFLSGFTLAYLYSLLVGF